MSFSLCYLRTALFLLWASLCTLPNPHCASSRLIISGKQVCFEVLPLVRVRSAVPYVLYPAPGLLPSPGAGGSLRPFLAPAFEVLAAQLMAKPEDQGSSSEASRGRLKPILGYFPRGRCGRKTQHAAAVPWSFESCRINVLTYEAASTLKTLLFGDTGWVENVQSRRRASDSGRGRGLTDVDGETDAVPSESGRESMPEEAGDHHPSGRGKDDTSDAEVKSGDALNMSGSGKDRGGEGGVGSEGLLSPTSEEALTSDVSQHEPESEEKKEVDLPQELPHQSINTAHRLLLGPLIGTVARLTSYLWSTEQHE